MDNCRLIVIGGSNGGFEAVQEIVSALPKDFHIPVAIVLHQLKRNTKSHLVPLLQRLTPLTVREPDDKEAILPAHIYLAAPNYHLMVEKDFSFSYSFSEPENYARPSIDVLFETAADAYGDSLLGVLLTGANSDGADGIKYIHQNKGTGLIQDPAEARSSYMPRAGIAACKQCQIMKSAEIIKKLISLNYGTRTA